MRQFVLSSPLSNIYIDNITLHALIDMTAEAIRTFTDAVQNMAYPSDVKGLGCVILSYVYLY